MKKGDRGIYHVKDDVAVYGKVLHVEDGKALIESWRGSGKTMQRRTWLITDIGYSNDPFGEDVPNEVGPEDRNQRIASSS